jgi:hypothetical protein
MVQERPERLGARYPGLFEGGRARPRKVLSATMMETVF